MPVTVLGALHVFTHLLLTPTYDMGRYCCYPHFTEGETSSERLSNLPKVTQLVSGGAGPQTQVPGPMLDHSPASMTLPASLGSARREWADAGWKHPENPGGFYHESVFAFPLPGNTYLDPRLFVPCLFCPVKLPQM